MKKILNSSCFTFFVMLCSIVALWFCFLQLAAPFMPKSKAASSSISVTVPSQSVVDYDNPSYTSNYYPSTTKAPTGNRSTEGYAYIPTKGGTKYHNLNTCSNMDDPQLVTIDDAIDYGYGECSKCW